MGWGLRGGVFRRVACALMWLAGQRERPIRAGGTANALCPPHQKRKKWRRAPCPQTSGDPLSRLAPPSRTLTRSLSFLLSSSKAHVPLRTFDDPAQALAYYAKGPATALPSRKRVLSLNGAWRFKLYDQPEAVPAGVWDEGFDDDEWADVSVFGEVGGAREKRQPSLKSSTSLSPSPLFISLSLHFRSPSPAIGRPRAMASPSTPTSITPGPSRRPGCRPPTRRAATGCG